MITTDGYKLKGGPVEALRQALAQSEQEFVGACVTCGAPKGEWLVDAVNMSQGCVDETAKGEHEPVCFLRETAWSYEIAPWDDPNGFPVYTAPSKQEYQYEVVAEHANGTYTTKRIPKREWVGLTDEEINDWFFQRLKQAGAGWALDDVVRAVEAKLKEKNK